MNYYRTTFIKGEPGHVHTSFDHERVVCYQKHPKFGSWFYEALTGAAAALSLVVIYLLVVVGG